MGSGSIPLGSYRFAYLRHVSWGGTEVLAISLRGSIKGPMVLRYYSMGRRDFVLSVLTSASESF